MYILLIRMSTTSEWLRDRLVASALVSFVRAKCRLALCLSLLAENNEKDS